MRFRGACVAGATLLVLAVGLPALGQAVGIYSVRWNAVGKAYATAQGGCGRVVLSEDPQHKRWFCFGDTLDVRHGGEPRGEATVVNLWIRELSCSLDGCDELTWTGVAPDVTYEIDPLLGTATVAADLPGCGTVDLTLTASSEPDLRNELGFGPPFAEVGPDDGRVQITAGGSASLGRDATVSGTICDDVVPSESMGRILRGLGSEGSSIDISYV